VKTTALEEALTHNARPTMLVLLAAAGFVLLIACANVANLNLSRMVRRERELAAARRARSGTCAHVPATADGEFHARGDRRRPGPAFSWGALSLLVSFAARFTPRAREIQMDSMVLDLLFSWPVLTSLLSGTAPALASREAVVGSLKEVGRSPRSGVGNTE